MFRIRHPSLAKVRGAMVAAIGSVLGIIPARSGSKGIPGKNVRSLAGRPLIAYAIDVGISSGVIDRLIVSTDSEEIGSLAKSLGAEVPFIRPAELAQDDTPMLPVLKHAVTELERTGWSPSVVVLLQPTAPLRTGNHVREALAILQESSCDSVVSVVRVPDHYTPHFVLRMVDDRLVHFLPEGQTVTRRQDVIPAYSRDGTVYVVRRDVLMFEHSIYGKDCRPLIIPSEESANLDTLDDWQRAEQIILAHASARTI